MDLQAWREKKDEGSKFLLPSGLTIRLRRVTIMGLIEAGGIPTPLMSVVNQLLEERVKLTAENVTSYMDAVNLVVKAAVIEPRIQDEPGEDALGIRELSTTDRITIYNWATTEVDALIPFREGSGESADPGQPGAALPAAPEHSPGAG